MSYPIISLVGRPNVGKSTLFNRLSNSRQALVSDFEGLTRDRQYANIELDNGIYCSIVDTGGLTNEDSIIDTGIHSQVINALNESDVIYFIVSNKDGVTSLDFDISAQLRKLKKNIILVCNIILDSLFYSILYDFNDWPFSQVECRPILKCR